MEHHLGRALTSSELVHHIDGNKLNNIISNLELTDRSSHASHHGKMRGVAMITIVCALCGEIAEKRKADVDNNRSKNKAGPFCGRKCAGVYSQRMQVIEINPSHGTLKKYERDKCRCNTCRVFKYNYRHKLVDSVGAPTGKGNPWPVEVTA